MALVGYQLHRAKTRPAGPVPPPPPRAAVTPPGEPPSARARPTVYEAPWRWTPRTRRTSLVFMDRHLPGAMDGLQAAARMWAQWRMPIIYLTGI
jgi:hypothetical protein